MNISKIPIDIRKLLQGALVIGTTPYYEYQNGAKTSTILGYKYNTILPNLSYEKLNVKIAGALQLDVADEAIPVKFEDVEAKMYCIDGRYDIAVTASSVSATAKNSAPGRQQP